MKASPILIFCGLLPLATQAQSIATTPVGASKVAAPANADTSLPLPLARPAVGSGKVASVSGSALAVTSPKAWASDQFTASQAHYVRFETGKSAGRYYTITANTSDLLTLDWNGEAPAVVEGDEFVVIPYWTLATVFPASEAGRAFVPSQSSHSIATMVYLRDAANPNVVPPTAYFFQAGAWRKLGDETGADYGSTPLSPDTVLTMRNRGTATQVITTGDVHAIPSTVVINALGGTERVDNELSLAIPASITLAQSNLVGGGAFEASSSAEVRRDELRIYTNKGHISHLAAIYYYSAGAWRKVGAPTDANFDQTRIFTEGTRVVLSKAGTGAEPKTAYWTQPSLVVN